MADINTISVNGATTDINKINLNGTEYNLFNSNQSNPTLTSVASTVQETQDREASNVRLSWTADENCNVMILMMHSNPTASFTTYEASCNLGTMGNLFANNDVQIIARASIFYLNSGDTISGVYRVYCDYRNFSYIRIYKIK